MPDTFSKRKRSAIMRAVHGYANKSTENRLAAIFRARKITGWRRGYPLFGSPDFVFPKERVAVFVDGCFWHGCPKHYRRPKSRRKYWDAKIQRNQQRDRQVTRILRAKGWRVVRIWEHALARRAEAGTVARLARIISDSKRAKTNEGEQNSCCEGASQAEGQRGTFRSGGNWRVGRVR